MAQPDSAQRTRGPFAYTIEVCAVCGEGLSMGITQRNGGRCSNPEHHTAGGVVIRVRPLPAFQQGTGPFAPSSRQLSRLVSLGAVPERSNEEWRGHA